MNNLQDILKPLLGISSSFGHNQVSLDIGMDTQSMLMPQTQRYCRPRFPIMRLNSTGDEQLHLQCQRNSFPVTSNMEEQRFFKSPFRNMARFSINNQNKITTLNCNKLSNSPNSNCWWTSSVRQHHLECEPSANTAKTPPGLELLDKENILKNHKILEAFSVCNTNTNNCILGKSQSLLFCDYSTNMENKTFIISTEKHPLTNSLIESKKEDLCLKQDKDEQLVHSEVTMNTPYSLLKPATNSCNNIMRKSKYSNEIPCDSSNNNELTSMKDQSSSQLVENTASITDAYCTNEVYHKPTKCKNTDIKPNSVEYLTSEGCPKNCDTKKKKRKRPSLKKRRRHQVQKEEKGPCQLISLLCGSATNQRNSNDSPIFSVNTKVPFFISASEISDCSSDDCEMSDFDESDDWGTLSNEFRELDTCDFQYNTTFTLSCDTFEPLENDLVQKANASWAKFYDNEPINPDFSHNKVKFAPEESLVSVEYINLHAEDYAQARLGPWEAFARDRDRFRKRIKDMELHLQHCFEPKHREKIYKTYFSSD